MYTIRKIFTDTIEYKRKHALFNFNKKILIYEMFYCYISVFMTKKVTYVHLMVD